MNKAEKFWDNRSGSFDSRSDEPDENYTQFIQNIKKHIKSEDRVLDFACGTGSYSFEIADTAAEIQGIDLSSKMIAIAQEKATTKTTENIHFFQATLFDDRLKPDTFDAILALNILHLIEDLPAAANRLKALLKPGGRLITSTPTLGEKKTFLSFIFIIFSKLNIVPHLKVMRFKDIEKSLIDADFQLIESEGMIGSPPHYFAVAEKR